MMTFPIGCRVKLDAAEQKITLLENPIKNGGTVKMSRDAIVYKIEKTDFADGIVIDSDDLNWNEYLYKEENDSPNYLKTIGQKITIRFHKTNYKKACFDKYNSVYNVMRYEFDGYTFFKDEVEIGFISNDIMKNYNYDEEKICYIAKIDEICRLDNCYKLSFDDGIYTFDEILNECILIVEDGDLNREEELIYGMVKALKHARDGENIYFCVD